MKDTIEIKKTLQNVGIYPNVKGYHYLAEAIRIVKETAEKGGIFDKYTALYALIGRKYQASAGSVERAIRVAVNIGFTNRTALYLDLFGANFTEAPPCTSCFVSVLAEHIMFRSKEE